MTHDTVGVTLFGLNVSGRLRSSINRGFTFSSDAITGKFVLGLEHGRSVGRNRGMHFVEVIPSGDILSCSC